MEKKCYSGYGSWLQFIIVWDTRIQKSEVASHIHSQDQKENKHARLLSHMRNGTTHSGLGLPSLVNVSNQENLHGYTQASLIKISLRLSSWVIVDCVKLTIKSSQSYVITYWETEILFQ